MRFFLLLILPIFLLSGCSDYGTLNTAKNRPNEEKPSPLESFFERFSKKEIAVVDESGNPVPGVRVLIGYGVGTPFRNNLLTAGEDGTVTLPKEWTSPLPLTLHKIGYVDATYFETQPKSHVFVMKKEKAQTQLELNGQVTGFGELKTDGFIDFALVIPSLKTESALNYDIASFVSPEMDVISVMGVSIRLPSNVFLPKQRENYGIFPINLEKAFFKLFFDSSGKYTVSANKGRFNFKKVADKLQNGATFFEVVNDIEFSSLTTQEVLVSNPKTTQNLDSSTTKLSPQLAFNIKHPDPKKMLFGIGLYKQGDRLVASDIKLRDEKINQNLSFPQGSTPQVLLALTKKEGTGKNLKISVSATTTLISASDLEKSILLDEIATPSVDANGITAQPPLPKGSVVPFATYAALSDVEIIQTNNYTLERKVVQWEFYSPNWITTVQKPSAFEEFNKNVKRWEIVYFGSNQKTSGDYINPQSLEYATHAVRNAADLQ